MRRIAVALAAALGLAPSAAALKVALVVEPGARPRAAQAVAGTEVSVLAFNKNELSDPIRKGRFLGEIQAAGLVVAAAGGRGCGWLGREVEGVPVRCVMPYSMGQVLDFAKSVGWRRLGVLHTFGYQETLARTRAAASKWGIEIVGVRVRGGRDLPEAVQGALVTVDALWILGDPLLTEGAAFEYLVEHSLARRVPLIAPGAESVSRGAFIGVESRGAEVLLAAISAATSAARGGARGGLRGHAAGQARDQ